MENFEKDLREFKKQNPNITKIEETETELNITIETPSKVEKFFMYIGIVFTATILAAVSILAMVSIIFNTSYVCVTDRAVKDNIVKINTLCEPK